MKTSHLPRHSPRGGFSLIEMIGVLAVIAIAMAALVPSLIQQTDAAVAAAEVASLQSFSTALQNNIQRTRAVPSLTNWVSVVATELGLATSNVVYTVRNQARVFLIDTNGFGKLTLPYSQASGGSANILTNSTPPRFMIVSSLGSALPALVGTNGYMSVTNFNALWNAAAGTVPANPGSPWIGWTGKSTDVNVQRLDLAYLFAHLILTVVDNTNAQYGIDGNTALNLSPTNSLNAWFLTTTVLNLYLAHTNLEAAQVLLRDSSWTFSGGGWRTSPAPAVSTNLTATTLVDGDPQDCCRQLNCQVFCTNACNPWSTTYPSSFCNDMSNCMSLYCQYAATGFTNHTVRNTLQSCCSQINNNDVPGLCSTHY